MTSRLGIISIVCCAAMSSKPVPLYAVSVTGSAAQFTLSPGRRRWMSRCDRPRTLDESSAGWVIESW